MSAHTKRDGEPRVGNYKRKLDASEAGTLPAFPFQEVRVPRPPRDTVRPRVPQFGQRVPRTKFVQPSLITERENVVATITGRPNEHDPCFRLRTETGETIVANPEELGNPPFLRQAAVGSGVRCEIGRFPGKRARRVTKFSTV